MSVCKSDEKLLIFASLIPPSKIILFETFDTVHVVFSTLFSMFHLVMKHCVLLLQSV